MKHMLSAMTNYFSHVPDKLRQRKYLVWSVFIALTIFAFMGLGKVKFDMTIEGWFADDDPTLVSLDHFHNEFGSEDHVIIVYKPKDGDVFSPKSLQLVRDLRDDLLSEQAKGGEQSPLDNMVRVTNLVTAPVFQAVGDSLITRHLFSGPIPEDKAEIEALRELALSQYIFPKLYFSADYQYGGIFIETKFGAIPLVDDSIDADTEAFEAEMMMDNMVMDEQAWSDEQERVRFKPTDLADYLDFMKEIKAVIEQPKYIEHFEFYPVGNAASTEYDAKMLEEMGMLYMAMLVIMIVILWFLFRSLSGVLWPITVVVLSCIWTVGITGWLGFTVTAFLILTIVMTLAVGIADSIHIMSGYLYFRKEGNDHAQALTLAFTKSARAILLTTVTTVIAMLSLTISPIIPIKVFGFMTALGITLAFVFSVYLLPLMLDLWSPVSKTSKQPNGLMVALGKVFPDWAVVIQRLLDKVLPIVERRQKGIVAVFMVGFIVCIYGATQIRVDTDPIAQYPQDAKIRQSFEIADTHMLGTQVMEIYLDLGTEYAFHDPKVLQAFDKLQKQLEQDYDKYVVRTQSLVQVVKDSYQTLNEERDEMYKIPEDPKMLAQTLFLFDNSNPVDRRRMVSDDYRRAHISVYLHNAGSWEYTRVFEQMRDDVDKTLDELKVNYPDAKVTITGVFTLMMQGADYLSWSSLSSFGLVVVIISVILLLVFGSLQAGVLSILPNLIPAMMTFGLMGLLNIPVDFTTVLIAPIIIGIAVDDTIHFLNHYRQEVSGHGDIHRALKTTINEVGQAVTFTSLILGLGLSVLALSSSVGNANVGIFGSMAVFVALLSDLFLLPALILMFKLRFNANEQSTSEQSEEHKSQQSQLSS